MDHLALIHVLDGIASGGLPIHCVHLRGGTCLQTSIIATDGSKYVLSVVDLRPSDSCGSVGTLQHIKCLCVFTNIKGCTRMCEEYKDIAALPCGYHLLYYAIFAHCTWRYDGQ